MIADPITLRPGRDVLTNALRDVTRTLAGEACRLGVAPPGALRNVKAFADHAERYGEPLPVNVVVDGMFIDQLAKPSKRTVWPVWGRDWNEVAARVVSVLLEAGAHSQGRKKNGDVVRDHRVAGAALAWMCAEIEEEMPLIN